MKNKIFTIVIFIILINTFESEGQINDFDLYKTAYNYLNDSVIKVNYDNAKTFAKTCNDCCVKGTKLRFDSDLQIANKFIENHRGFPLCDLLQKRYRISESCVYALGSGEFELTNHVQDSLDVFWTGYKMKTRTEITKTITKLLSKKKDGYQVFFSDVYKNTLAAEVKGFCLPFDSMMWMGSSTSFYFIFNDDGQIEQVYSGVSIHYN